MTLNPARGFWVMMNCELLYRGVVWFVAFWWKNDWNEINPPIIWRECSVVVCTWERREGESLMPNVDHTTKHITWLLHQKEPFEDNSSREIFTPFRNDAVCVSMTFKKPHSAHQIRPTSTHWLRRHHIFLVKQTWAISCVILIGIHRPQFFA